MRPNYLLFDPILQRQNLLPFTFTRPVGNLRVGILTINEKWQNYLGITQIGYETQTYLSAKFPGNKEGICVFINGSICPNATLISEINGLNQAKTALVKNGQLLAVCLNLSEGQTFSEDISNYNTIESKSDDHIQLNFCYEIFTKNGEALQQDFNDLTKGRKSQPIPDGNQVLNPENIFIEEGASIHFSILNASTGPIYIGKNAEVMEGCKIRGPFALCEDAGLKMDAKIYGATTVGPHCKVGGEVNNSVFYAYSNKGHDGFVGNAVIGEWVNIGADTNNSNLKNTYDEVKLWSYRTERFEKTGLTFCGLMMADHAKCGINTMFNTGTVVGVGANIFGDGYPRNFIPSFAWGGAAGFTTFQINKALDTAAKAMERRGKTLDEPERLILQKVYDDSARFRVWEKK